MKKGIFAIVIAAVVVAGVVFGLRMMKAPMGPASTPMGETPSTSERSVTEVFAPQGDMAIADVIPSDCVVFVSARNAKSTWDLVKNSNFWKKASNLTLWETAQVGANMAAFKEQFKTNLGFEISEENILGLFGQDLSIALLGSKEGLANPQLLLLSKTDPRTDVQGKMNLILEKVKANVTTETVEYNGQKITRIRNPQVPGPEFNYAFIGNIFALAIGIDDSSLRKVVDLSGKKSTESLSASTQYKDAVGALKIRGELRGVVYVNMARIVDLIKALPTPEGTPAGFAAGLEQTLGAIKTISAAIGFDKGMLVKLFFVKNQDAEKSDLLSGWEAAPKESESLKLLPEESLLLSVSNSIELSSIWDSWQKNLEAQAPEQSKSIMDGITAFEQSSGIKIKEDLLGVLSDEICFALTNVDMTGLFPFPHVTLLAKVKDEAKAKDIMKRLSDYAVMKSTPEGVTPAAAEQVSAEGEAAPGAEAPAGGAAAPASQMTTGKEDYNGVEINYLEIRLPYQTLNPSYAVIKGFIVIGVNKDTVKSIIDVSQGTKSAVTKNETFISSTGGFSAKVNQIAFLNMDRAMGLIIDITKWANNLQKARGEAGAQTDQLIQQNVLPLLDALKVFKAIAVEAINRDEGIEETLYVKMEDLKE